ncbi:MAG: hypothetical protein ACOX50_03600 [Patescibacteria group bacterium]
MLKILLVIVTFLSSLTLTGCSFKPNENGKTIFGFVRKNVGKAVYLQCDYFDENGKQQIAYIKNSATRIDGVETKSGVWSVLIRDKMIWMWKPEETTGLFFDLTQDTITDKKSKINPKEIVEKIEYQKQNCSPAIIPDERFELPGNIEFTGE